MTGRPFAATIEALDFALWEMEVETSRRETWEQIARAIAGFDGEGTS